MGMEASARSDTIAAIATAPGRAGVAIVRVSGPDAFLIGERLTGKKPSGGKVCFSRIREYPNGNLIDEAVVLSFKGPKSFTGEDVVEFQCHGGEVTPRRVLESCFSAGARLSMRGEFTQRAFLNGKIRFEDAQALLDLINAKTSSAADEALSRFGGSRSKRSKYFYDKAIEISTRLEHTLDIDESELSCRAVEEIKSNLESFLEEITRYISDLKRGRILHDGAVVVLAGAPNAGKSSLLNVLVGENKAIVSSIPGTTRDAIEQWVDIEGFPVKLVDTAGLRDADDEIEAEGVLRSRELISKADIVIALDCDIDGAVKVHSKCDISRGPGMNVSSKTLEGIGELRGELVKRLSVLEPKQDDANIDCFIHARGIIADVLAEKPSFTDVVLAANAIRTVADELGRCIGASYSEDMLESLFSRFCVGK